MDIKQTLKEILLGIFPVLILITLLQFTIAPVPFATFYNFLIATLFVICGLFLFLFGIEFGFLKIGEHIGSALVKTGHMRLLLLFGVILGFGVTLLEPDVQVFSDQVANMLATVNGTTLAAIIAIGVGIFTAIAFLRMFLNVPIKYILIAGYLLAFLLVLICPPEISSVAFDAGGATTGILTVPFILSLAMGISSLISKKKSTSNSFGIIGIASLGPILSVLIMGVIAG